MYFVMRKTGNENFVKAIIDSIQAWRRTTPGKLIVGLEGTSGIGKTTIAKQIIQRAPWITLVHLDQFVFPAFIRIRRLRIAEDKPAIYRKKWYDIKKLQCCVAAFRDKGSKQLEYIHSVPHPKTGIATTIRYAMRNPVLLLDGVFLQDRMVFGTLCDRYIFLTTSRTVIERRRVRRWKRHSRGSRVEQKLRRDTHLIFDVAWERYMRDVHPEQHADCIIKMRIKGRREKHINS